MDINFSNMITVIRNVNVCCEIYLNCNDALSISKDPTNIFLVGNLYHNLCQLNYLSQCFVVINHLQIQIYQVLKSISFIMNYSYGIYIFIQGILIILEQWRHHSSSSSRSKLMANLISTIYVNNLCDAKILISSNLFI